MTKKGTKNGSKNALQKGATKSVTCVTLNLYLSATFGRNERIYVEYNGVYPWYTCVVEVYTRYVMEAHTRYIMGYTSGIKLRYIPGK